MGSALCRCVGERPPRRARHEASDRGPFERRPCEAPSRLRRAAIAGPTLRWRRRKGIGRFPDRRPRWPDPQRDLTSALLDLPRGPAENRPTTHRRTPPHRLFRFGDGDGNRTRLSIHAASRRARRRRHDQLVPPHRMAERGPARPGRRGGGSGPGPRAGARRRVRHPERLRGRRLDAREGRARRARRRVASRDSRRLGRGGRRAGRGRPLPEAAHADAGARPRHSWHGWALACAS